MSGESFDRIVRQTMAAHGLDYRGDHRSGAAPKRPPAVAASDHDRDYSTPAPTPGWS
jgi:hypothetical protein